MTSCSYYLYHQIQIVLSRTKSILFQRDIRSMTKTLLPHILNFELKTTL